VSGAKSPPARPDSAEPMAEVEGINAADWCPARPPSRHSACVRARDQATGVKRSTSSRASARIAATRIRKIRRPRLRIGRDRRTAERPPEMPKRGVAKHYGDVSQIMARLSTPRLPRMVCRSGGRRAGGSPAARPVHRKHRPRWAQPPHRHPEVDAQIEGRVMAA